MQPIDQVVPAAFWKLLGLSSTAEIPPGRLVSRTVSVLFADLYGFTRLSAELPPPALLAFLNRYLAHVVPPIHAAGGLIDKFIGDTVMAIFVSPSSDGALTAARDMCAALGTFNAAWTAEGHPALESAIGVHTGELGIATVGCAERVDFTVVGEAVNVAARVQGLAGKHGVKVLVSAATAASIADPSRFTLRLVDAAASLKGLPAPIALHELQV